MRKAKWIFVGYLALVVLIVAGIAISFSAAPPRNPQALTLPILDSIRTLDPAEVNDDIGHPLVGSLYEGLYNYKYGVKPYTMFPDLASQMPQISPDGLVWTIKLRKGIHFYDPTKKVFSDGIGPEVKAADVAYSFKRVGDFNLASPNYSWFDGLFVGLDKWWEYTKNTPKNKVDFDRPVEGFEVVDDYTIRFHLMRPDPQFIFLLAHDPTMIVCRRAVEYWGDSFRQHPVGTGAYALVQNLPDQRMVFEENPIYRGKSDIDGTTPLAKDDPSREPHIKRVEYQYFAETLPVWWLLKQGYFDLIADIPKDAFRQAIKNGELAPELTKLGLRRIPVTETATDYISFNMADPVLGKNKPLRQAMSMAFDRTKYVNDFWMGVGQPATSVIPPTLPTYDASEKNPYTGLNLLAAQALMEQAKRIQGGPIPPLKLLMRGADTTSRQMGEFMATQMARIGVTLEPEYRDWARWQEMTDNRQTQVFDSGWVADYPDEQDFYQLFYSKNIPNAGVNSFVYSNPAFDALYEKAMVMQDSPERRELYKQMNRMLNEDCPGIWVYYRMQNVLVYDWVQEYSWMDYGYAWRQHLTLDQAMRTKAFASGVFRH
ncbi:MAG TPA: ABC transporter substrate-binding protein [Humisphaera sp.]|jgi:ABC-type transport system substrate-binding protein|nr:ABC transporter substrate-binding protein [Humisphaera sp.]